MTHKRIVAVLALAAFTLGVGISFANLSNDPSVSASDMPSVNEKANQSESIEPSQDFYSTNEASKAQTEPETEPDVLATPAPMAELSGVVEVDNQALLSQAIIASAVTEVILTADIDIPVDIAKQGGIIFYRPLELAPMKLNLNGHNISTEGPFAMHVFYGDLDIIGQGTISAKTIAIDVRGATDPAFSSYTNLTIGKDVTLSAPGAYSLVIDKNSASTAYGASVVFNGTINAMQGPYVNGSIQHSENPAKIKIGDTAVINAEKLAIYAAGYANWNIGAARITSETGVGLKAGTFEFNNTIINTSGIPQEPEIQTGGMDSTGVVFQIEHNKNYADEDITININSGSYTSAHNSVFYEYGDTSSDSARSTSAPADININGGAFTAADGFDIFGGTSAQNNIEVTAGTFHGADANDESFQDYFVGDLKFDQNGNVIAAQPVPPSKPSNPSTSSPVSPETPSEEPSAALPEEATPDTGINQARGKLSAVNTVAPVVVGAVCIIAMVLGKKIFSHLKSLRIAEVDCEIATEVAEVIEDEPEPVIERFVATKIDRDDPVPPMVDTFISFK